VFRKDLLTVLADRPRSVSWIARELGLTRGEVEDDLRHLIRSARAAGHAVVVEPARCRACGFMFGEDRLAKPGKCPMCRSTRLYEAQINIVPADATPGYNPRDDT
jgi:predicted Zn-ribbon and HTH transcriptional regulator